MKQRSKELLLKLLLLEAQEKEDKAQNSYETASPQVPKHLKYYPPFFYLVYQRFHLHGSQSGDLNEFHDKRLSEGSSVALA